MRFLISAGPTREAVDAVRFFSNHSTGKMGYALAQAAIEAGHMAVLVSGPVALPPVPGAEMVRVTTAAEMAEAVKSRFADCDVAIMAAAVADYRPKNPAANKLKKRDGDLVIELERTEDILSSIGKMKRPGQILAGFAAETDDVEENALGKLRRKNLDFIAANDVSKPGCGFAADTNSITVYAADGRCFHLPFGLKTEVAKQILNIITGDTE